MNQYICPECPAGFRDYAAYVGHVVTEHPVELLPPAVPEPNPGALAMTALGSFALAAVLVALAAFVGGRL